MYKDFDITPQHLKQVIRDNNITRKRTRHERWIKNLRFFIHPTFNKIKLCFILLNEHPAIFPEQLAQDHILSWSNENDIILDSFLVLEQQIQLDGII